MSLDPVISLTLSWGLALLFAGSALHKLRGWGGFVEALAGYRLLPPPLVTPLAACLWLAESATAAGLALRETAAAAVAAALLASYALAMAVNLWRGRRLLDCGCGGTPQPVSWMLVARNGMLVIASLAALIPAGERPLGWLDGFTALAAVAAIAAVYGAIDALGAARARLEAA